MWSSVYESHGRSISSGPDDWPGLALRRSDAMQRYSPLNSSMALNGLASPAIVEFKPPPRDEQKGKAGARFLIADANKAFLIERHRRSALCGLLREHAGRRGRDSRRRTRLQQFASDRIHHRRSS